MPTGFLLQRSTLSKAKNVPRESCSSLHGRKGKKEIVSSVKSLPFVRRSIASKNSLANRPFIMLMPFSNLRIEPRKKIP